MMGLSETFQEKQIDGMKNMGKIAICISIVLLIAALTSMAVAAQSPIDDKYAALDGNSGFLGMSITEERTAPDSIGHYLHFEGGSIYWHPDTGAHEVHGLIRDKWGSLDWERGFLGYPLTDETTTPDGIGRFNHFQGGSIYWTPDTGAHEVHGLIRDKWGSLDWERGFLGYPLTDELSCQQPDSQDRYQVFNGGRLYWRATTNEVTFFTNPTNFGDGGRCITTPTPTDTTPLPTPTDTISPSITMGMELLQLIGVILIISGVLFTALTTLKKDITIEVGVSDRHLKYVGGAGIVLIIIGTYLLLRCNELI